ncbi:MAG TPA: UDP-N-acetylglucosamine 1-carboxyvinyltransferase [Candidatus Magasanikbacteria bacterium]|nr:UDP-N-acetylglucosamine 1-carboxyvinyltransferase [Candidatus Magasanikbacteria bacterium]
MATYVINGGKKLHGSIAVRNAKNSALALLSASVMVAGKVTLKDMPRIEEVYRFIEILKSINVSCEWSDDHTLVIDSSQKLQLEKIDKTASSKIRSSLLLLGSLASRVPSYRLYRSGGCKLGERTVRPHLYALEKFGIQISTTEEHYEVVTSKKLKAAYVVMYEAGDTPTENAIMAAACAEGTTTIKFASANYMVQDLCYFLVKAGVKISGIGTQTLIIQGVKHFKAKVEYHVMPDPLEGMGFIAAAITTGSTLTIENCPIDFLELELEKLSVMGQKFTISHERMSKNGKFRIVDIEIIPSKLTALPDKIHGMPFPGINIDNVPLFIPIVTQAKGRTLIHDWVFENRTFYYLEFQKLGAKVTLLDPHRVFVEGVTPLVAREIIAPDGIRPAMALLVGMLAAKGTSKLRDIYVIERGYEDLETRLRSIGADITRND